MQAAILLEKLAIYEEEIDRRQVVARRYADALASAVAIPRVPEGCVSVWAQYTLTARDNAQRERIRTALQAAGIPSAIYYPRPLHLQTAYADFPRDPRGLETAERLAERVLSLPMHPYLDAADQEEIVSAVLQGARE